MGEWSLKSIPSSGIFPFCIERLITNHYLQNHRPRSYRPFHDFVWYNSSNPHHKLWMGAGSCNGLCRENTSRQLCESRCKFGDNFNVAFQTADYSKDSLRNTSTAVNLRLRLLVPSASQFFIRVQCSSMVLFTHTVKKITGAFLQKR